MFFPSTDVVIFKKKKKNQTEHPKLNRNKTTKQQNTSCLVNKNLGKHACSIGSKKKSSFFTALH